MKKIFILSIVLSLVCTCVQASKIYQGIDIINLDADRQYDSDGESQDLGFSVTELRIPVSARLALYDYLDVGVMIPFVSRSMKNTMDMSSSDLGDVDLFVEYKILKKEDDSINLTGHMALTFPTGKSAIQDVIGSDELPVGGPMTGTGTNYASSFGGGSYNLNLALGFGKKMGSVKGYAKLGYLITMETEAGQFGNAKFDYGDTVMYALAVKYQTGRAWLGLAIEGASTGPYRFSGAEVSNTDSNIIKITPGVKVTIGENLYIKGKVAVPISGKNEINGMTIRIGISYEKTNKS